MSNNITTEELLRRYLFQVSRRLPREQREDVVRELDSLLRETLENKAREVGRPVSAKDTASVLKELGSPAEMARRYAPRPNYLIGPKTYPVFILTLKAALLGAVGLAGLVAVVSTLFGSSASWLAAGSLFLRLSFQLAYSFAALAVLVFAVLERVDTETLSEFQETDWDPFSLPPLEESEQVSATELGIKIYAIVILMIWFNVFPQWVGIILSGSSGPAFVPISQLGLTLPLLMMSVWWCAALAKNVLLLRKGRWTSLTRGLDVLLGVGAVIILGVILGDSLAAVHSEQFRHAIANPKLVAVFSRLIPAVTGIILVLVAGSTAMRLYRLFWPKTHGNPGGPFSETIKRNEAR